jgi:putative restriction endonuclease
MRYYVGITDEGWYQSLKAHGAEEGNFWKPGQTPFRYLEPGGYFLFKLKAPKHFIVGGGHFVRYVPMPMSAAWSAFELDNGVSNYLEFMERIIRLRHSDEVPSDPEIGCIILQQLFFFDREDWIPAPNDWAPNIVSGKGFDSREGEGLRVWTEVRQRLEQVSGKPRGPQVVREVGFVESLGNRRLGQGAFRALVVEAYERRCAITGERTLPTLEAAHIRPVQSQGTHCIQNGVLLRSDLHRLFDSGLVSISPDLRVRVSSQIRERYLNGKDYYALQDKPLAVLPAEPDLRPGTDHLAWHSANIFIP